MQQAYHSEETTMMDFARTCYRPKPHSLLRSIFESFCGLWVKIEHRNKSACMKWFLCKAADLNHKLSEKRASAQISIEQHSYFRWLLPCEQKLGNNLWIKSNQNLLSQISSKGKIMPESYEETCLDWTSFNFLSKDFFFAICYWK